MKVILPSHPLDTIHINTLQKAFLSDVNVSKLNRNLIWRGLGLSADIEVLQAIEEAIMNIRRTSLGSEPQ